MEVLPLTPRGYCHGVVDAIALAERAAVDDRLPKPITILGMIVHNRHVVDALAQMGIRSLDGPNRLELIAQVERGTVIFTAHGVSPQVRAYAQRKGLTVLDATCSDVTRTHDLIAEKARESYLILYIGKPGHPEPEGAIGEAPGQVILVSSIEEAEQIQIDAPRIAITTQTTMSQWDTAAMVSVLQQRFPQAEVYNEICLATQERQEAVARRAGEADCVVVVGDPRSNNTQRLAEVAEQVARRKAYRVEDVTEIDPKWFTGCKRVAVTSGASTPTPITQEVIRYLAQLQPEDPTTWNNRRVGEPTHVLPKVRL
ncbi:MAG: 4-hydroxy-3-methylbut-2-enyl diphosphate reductase [Firmicutes bacterium]|nr:4-hydroxy-3-methylbut-2-enyl diphosphate reductase [Bacillota bacterium]